LHIARTRFASQYPPQPAKDCAMPESVKAKAIEATITILDGRLLETGFVTSASSSIRVNLNQ
jgi:hypothetical protein